MWCTYTPLLHIENTVPSYALNSEPRKFSNSISPTKRNKVTKLETKRTPQRISAANRGDPAYCLFPVADTEAQTDVNAADLSLVEEHTLSVAFDHQKVHKNPVLFDKVT